MRTQLALDVSDLSAVHKFASIGADAGFDSIELGTPTLTLLGVDAISSVRAALPTIHLYADTKLNDHPELIIRACARAGAQWVTLLLSSNDEIAARAIEVANEEGVTIAATTLGYPIGDLGRRVKDLAHIGIEHFVAHGASAQLSTAFAECMRCASEIRRVSTADLIMAGGIGIDNVTLCATRGANGIIVGRSVTASEEPATAARHLVLAARSIE